MNIKESNGWKCGECGTSYTHRVEGSGKAKEAAEKCCICPDCGKPKGHNMGDKRCSKCTDIYFAKLGHERMKKRIEVEYDGRLVLSDGNDFFYDEDGLYEWFDKYEWFEDLPEWLTVCGRHDLSLDIDSILENALTDEHHEEAGEQICNEDKAKVQVALDELCKNAKVESYSEGYKHKVSVAKLVLAYNLTQFEDGAKEALAGE